MKKMKIKKLGEEITYRKIVKMHEFEVNGKKVRVEEYQEADAIFSDYDSKHTINEEDEKKLTEREAEAIGEYMQENLDLKVGEEWNTDTCHACGEIQDEDGRCKCTNADGK